MNAPLPTLVPSLAVVICTKNRPGALLTTLDSIWSQSCLPQELVVIDDGQLPDSVRDTINDSSRIAGVAVHIESNQGRGLTCARNLAADIARSEILVYIDDDVTCDPGFLKVIADLMTDPQVAGVTANVIEPSLDNFSGRLYKLGYRISGWWSIAPHGTPPGSRPRAMNSSKATRARWLSGAAMALRREVVRENRFDESLTQYALGEDREMGYRVSSRYWLLEAPTARVIHRRDGSERPDHRRFGHMTSYNYLYVLEKTCRLGPGQWLLIAWSLAVLMLMHAIWAVIGNFKAHGEELIGMVAGIRDYIRRPRPIRHEFPINLKSNRPSTLIARSANRADDRSEISRSLMRALFVTNRLETGGAELMLVTLAKQLLRVGIAPVIACLKDAGPLAMRCREAGIPVYDRLLHHKADAAAISRLRKVITECHIDAVIVAHSGGDRMFWSTLAAALADAPVIVWSHWFPQGGRRHIERPNRALYRWVDSYIALGERHRNALIRHEHIPAGRICVISNAIDLARFMNLVPRSEARRQLRLTDQQIGIGMIANLRSEKRHDVFIAAARRLSKTHSHLRFFIIGDGPHRDAVQAAAAASGLDHEILRWMGNRDDVPELLSGLDVACLCSEVECFSVSMLEAAAAKCAFIGPNTGCIPEFLEHGRTGLLIRPADVASLTDGILELCQDAALRDALADAAQARVVREFGIERMAARFSELVRSLPMRRRRPQQLRRRRSLEAASLAAIGTN